MVSLLASPGPGPTALRAPARRPLITAPTHRAIHWLHIATKAIGPNELALRHRLRPQVLAGDTPPQKQASICVSSTAQAHGAAPTSRVTLHRPPRPLPVGLRAGPAVSERRAVRRLTGAVTIVKHCLLSNLLRRRPHRARLRGAVKIGNIVMTLIRTLSMEDEGAPAWCCQGRGWRTRGPRASPGWLAGRAARRPTCTKTPRA